MDKLPRSQLVNCLSMYIKYTAMQQFQQACPRYLLHENPLTSRVASHQEFGLQVRPRQLAPQEICKQLQQGLTLKCCSCLPSYGQDSAVEQLNTTRACFVQKTTNAYYTHTQPAQ